MSAITEDSPVYAPFFGVMGAASAIIFSGESQLFPISSQNTNAIIPA